MKKVISIGVQDFEKLRMNHGFYVDKTDFIREWWQGTDDVTLITRPRRFGKTLNLSTLNCFFSNKYADRGDLLSSRWRACALAPLTDPYGPYLGIRLLEESLSLYQICTIIAGFEMYAGQSSSIFAHVILCFCPRRLRTLNIV